MNYWIGVCPDLWLIDMQLYNIVCSWFRMSNFLNILVESKSVHLQSPASYFTRISIKPSPPGHSYTQTHTQYKTFQMVWSHIGISCPPECILGCAISVHAAHWSATILNYRLSSRRSSIGTHSRQLDAEPIRSVTDFAHELSLQIMIISMP